MMIQADAEKTEDEVVQTPGEAWGGRSGLAKSQPSLEECCRERRAKVALVIRNRTCQRAGVSLGVAPHMAGIEKTLPNNGM